jgi:hypothetical protein
VEEGPCVTSNDRDGETNREGENDLEERDRGILGDKERDEFDHKDGKLERGDIDPVGDDVGEFLDGGGSDVDTVKGDVWVEGTDVTGFRTTLYRTSW